jgi:uncharacterized protein YgiM (DUF1202 family)
MKRYLTIIALLLAALACSLSAPPAALLEVQNTPTPTFTPAAMRILWSSPTPPPTTCPEHMTATPTQAASCKVKTGLQDGRLNLRSCAGVDCPAIAWLQEGAPLTILPTPPANGWLPVQVGDLKGWVNSTFCEVDP